MSSISHSTHLNRKFEFEDGEINEGATGTTIQSALKLETSEVDSIDNLKNYEANINVADSLKTMKNDNTKKDDMMMILVDTTDTIVETLVIDQAANNDTRRFLDTTGIMTTETLTIDIGTKLPHMIMNDVEAEINIAQAVLLLTNSSRQPLRQYLSMLQSKNHVKICPAMMIRQ
ncbi:unnamed protein product [Absidia cylindrospora]